MAIVGFNFKKIEVEKKTEAKGKINISNNVAIKEVEEAQLSLGKSKQTALKLTFEFHTKYEPDMGKIFLVGDVVYMGSEKVLKETMKEWKDSKKIPDSISREILGTVLEKCNIQAIVLSRDLNLPTPVPLPKIQPKK